MRKLMRLVVTDGFGKQAEVPGYYPGGKTGTAEKVGKHGYKRGFKENFNVAAFTSVFPMNAPRYAVYMMLDEPHGNKSTYGYSTAGWVAAPAAGRVIARIGADAGHAAGHAGRAGDQCRRWPSRWSRAGRRAPWRAGPQRQPPSWRRGRPREAPAKPGLTVPATTMPTPRSVAARSRREAALPAATVAAGYRGSQSVAAR